MMTWEGTCPACHQTWRLEGATYMPTTFPMYCPAAEIGIDHHHIPKRMTVVRMHKQQSGESVLSGLGLKERA